MWTNPKTLADAAKRTKALVDSVELMKPICCIEAVKFNQALDTMENPDDILNMARTEKLDPTLKKSSKLRLACDRSIARTLILEPRCSS
jgi:hypothetical protein